MHHYRLWIELEDRAGQLAGRDRRSPGSGATSSRSTSTSSTRTTSLTTWWWACPVPVDLPWFEDLFRAAPARCSTPGRSRSTSSSTGPTRALELVHGAGPTGGSDGADRDRGGRPGRRRRRVDGDLRHEPVGRGRTGVDHPDPGPVPRAGRGHRARPWRCGLDARPSLRGPRTAPAARAGPAAPEVLLHRDGPGAGTDPVDGQHRRRDPGAEHHQRV